MSAAERREGARGQGDMGTRGDTVLKGGSIGRPDSLLGDTSSGLRSQQSGIGYGLSGAGTGADPEPVPGAEHLNLIPEGRDLGPENESCPQVIFQFPVSL